MSLINYGSDRIYTPRGPPRLPSERARNVRLGTASRIVPSLQGAAALASAEPRPSDADLSDSSARSSGRTASSDGRRCAICLSESSEILLRATSCGHRFCDQCLGTYMIRRPLSAQMPCPLCRAPLNDRDLPPKIVLSLTPTDAGVFGVSLTSSRGEGNASVCRVVPGSAAEAAGLRPGQRILAVEGVAVEGGVHGTSLLRSAAKSFCETRSEGGAGPPVHVEIARLRPPASILEAILRDVDATRRGGASDPYLGENCVLSTAFCCCVVGQLWQRVMKTPRWSCVLVAAALWLLVLICVAAVGVTFAGRGGGHDLATHRLLFIPLGAASAVLCWCVASCLLARVRAALLQKDGESWQQVSSVACHPHDVLACVAHVDST